MGMTESGSIVVSSAKLHREYPGTHLDDRTDKPREVASSASKSVLGSIADWFKKLVK